VTAQTCSWGVGYPCPLVLAAFLSAWLLPTWGEGFNNFRGTPPQHTGSGTFPTLWGKPGWVCCVVFPRPHGKKPGGLSGLGGFWGEWPPFEGKRTFSFFNKTRPCSRGNFKLEDALSSLLNKTRPPHKNGAPKGATIDWASLRDRGFFLGTTPFFFLKTTKPFACLTSSVVSWKACWGVPVLTENHS